jgi:hypothetical protein
MSDIVERLRAWSPLISSGLEVPAAALVIDEAATEIERLRARVEVLEAVLHAIFPDGANIKLVPKANAEEAKP